MHEHDIGIRQILNTCCLSPDLISDVRTLLVNSTWLSVKCAGHQQAMGVSPKYCLVVMPRAIIARTNTVKRQFKRSQNESPPPLRVSPKSAISPTTRSIVVEKLYVHVDLSVLLSNHAVSRLYYAEAIYIGVQKDTSTVSSQLNTRHIVSVGFIKQTPD